MLTSSGSYIANLHDGDLYDPHCGKVKRALDENRHAAFVFNAYREMDAHGREGRSGGNPSVGSQEHGFEHVYFRRWRFDSPALGDGAARPPEGRAV